MLLNFNNDSQLNLNRFSRLGRWYILALSVIALAAIVGQVLIQSHLSGQLSDSRIVNVAGKQRMLSQEISKTVLLLKPGQSTTERKTTLRNLETSVSLWKTSHQGLQSGNDSLQLPGHNSSAIVALFLEVNIPFDAMRQSAEKVIHSLQYNLSLSYDSLYPDIRNLLDHEGSFLAGMEKIASQYDSEAHGKVSSLRRMEYFILFISLFIILVEILFIFRPTASDINKTLNKLIASEKNARKLSKEIGALYASLEKSYEQIAIVNQPVENPRLYARADRGGNVSFISDNFKSLADDLEVKNGMRLSDLFMDMDDPDDWMDEVVDTVSEGKFWQGDLRFKGRHEKICWAAIVVTPVYNDQDEIDELMVMGSDITRRKVAEQSMNLKNRAEIEKKINQQKFRSVLILEGQEEERNRIAMDIHDGIGQMLTSLKYQIESIDLKAGDKARQKITEVDQLIKEVIREVRRVTFNLKPTVLGDYGLQAALNVFVQEIGKLVEVKLTYKTSGKIDRLPQKIENNIFRIIQEAINNAIKYSQAETIEIDLNQSDNDLIIMVKDEGKGFDTRLVEARSVNIESGRGFFNMYERTEYVNGHLSIQSEPSRGTTVTLTVPVKNAVSLEV